MDRLEAGQAELRARIAHLEVLLECLVEAIVNRSSARDSCEHPLVFNGADPTRFLSRGERAAAIYMGENGATCRDRGRRIHVPVHDAGPVVESMRARDAFDGEIPAARASGTKAVEEVRSAA